MIAFVHASRRLATRTVARALDLFAQLRETMAEVRENRRKLEAELFRNRYPSRRRTTTISQSCADVISTKTKGEVSCSKANLPRRVAPAPRSS
jgi:hypothetical protein